MILLSFKRDNLASKGALIQALISMQALKKQGAYVDTEN
jgi:hypothetical protein